MVKYFLKVLFTLVFLKLLSKAALGSIVLLTPHNGEVLEEPLAHFTWEMADSQVEYVFKYYIYIRGFVNGTAITRIIEEQELTRGTLDNRIYFWKVQYHPKATFDGKFDFESDIFVFGVNKEIPQEVLEEYVYGNEEEEEKEEGEEEKEEEVEDEMEYSVEEEDILELPFLPVLPENDLVQDSNDEDTRIDTTFQHVPTLQRIKEKDIAVQQEEFNWNVKSQGNVLGIKEKGKEVCRFKYIREKEEVEKIYCNPPKLNITEQIDYPVGNDHSIYLTGDVVTNFNIVVDEYVCDFSLFRPSTWFNCEERYVKSTTLQLQPHMLFQVYQKNKRVTVRAFDLQGRQFRLLAGYVKDVDDIRLVHKYRLINSEFNIMVDVAREYPIEAKVAGVASGIDESRTKPFGFPFNRIIGVTQWYGYTAFQSPHAGIDFGARKESVVAIGDGEVVSKGWDSYGGECFSGGKYLIVKHENGMHSTYFHLEEMYVNTGDFVKRGQVIAKSGNSGAWNCQRLGYHLHFETRLTASPRTHRNPVDYIDIDWQKVPTLGYERFPGRLTGENPHIR